MGVQPGMYPTTPTSAGPWVSVLGQVTHDILLSSSERVTKPCGGPSGLSASPSAAERSVLLAGHLSSQDLLVDDRAWMDNADSLLKDLGYGQGFFHRLPQTVFESSQGDLCALQAAGSYPPHGPHHPTGASWLPPCSEITTAVCRWVTGG